MDLLFLKEYSLNIFHMPPAAVKWDIHKDILPEWHTVRPGKRDVSEYLRVFVIDQGKP